jgi:hypothetical protein
MNNSQVGQKFADGAIKGHSSNMYIEGDTVYSYGYHFPIAVRLANGQYLFNCDTYSNSTARHKNHVLSVIDDDKLIRMPTNAIKQYKWKLDDCKNIAIEYWKHERYVAGDKLTRARSEHMKEFYKREIIDAEVNISKINNLKNGGDLCGA